MKKLLSIVLALALVFTFAVSAFAATDKPVPSSENQIVQLEVTESGTIYNVDIEWGNMKFTYNLGAWNPGTHKYDGAGSWVVDAGQAAIVEDEATVGVQSPITVTNHSNAPVDAALSLAGYDDGAVTGVTDDLTVKTMNLVAAPEHSAQDAVQQVSQYQITGTPDRALALTTVNTITVALSVPTP